MSYVINVFYVVSLINISFFADTMFLQCLKWIPHLCHQLVWLVAIHKKGFVKPLPDDIIIDILSRLLAECVLECRKVCRVWLALTSMPHFIEMHHKRAIPEILCSARIIEIW